MSGMHEVQSSPVSSNLKNPENQTNSNSRDATPGSDLWTDGLICAFEYVKIPRRISRSKYGSKIQSLQQVESDSMKKQLPEDRVYGASDKKLNRKHLSESESLVELTSGHITFLDNQVDHQSSLSEDHYHMAERFSGSRWVPIGWARISELVQTVQMDASWALQHQQFELLDNEDERSVADLATPYWEQPAGPIWWCHVAAGHQLVDTWLSNSQWLHPAIRTALRDESRLISERMKYLLYEVPVRVAGGLLFELLGQSAGDPFRDEDDIPIVLRSWHAQRFLVTTLHVKGHASSINVLGITEVQELLSAGSYNEPKTVHDIIALLATRLSRWDDRLFRKSIFGAADEVELKFMNRRHQEDMNLLSIILNQEIRRLSRQVIRVKWSLHAREEIVFEFLQHLRGDAARSLLQGVMKNTREMIEEQEAVRGRLFTIQDVMQSTVRAWLQDRSLRVTHNLAVFGGCGLVLSIITGLFGINVDGIPGAAGAPYAFGLFAAVLVLIGMILIAFGLLYLGLKKPITEAQVMVRKLELQQLVKSFQHEAETHAQVSKSFPRNNLTPTAADIIPADADYVVIR